jgi:hypothetical protein
MALSDGNVEIRKAFLVYGSVTHYKIRNHILVKAKDVDRYLNIRSVIGAGYSRPISCRGHPKEQRQNASRSSPESRGTPALPKFRIAVLGKGKIRQHEAVLMTIPYGMESRWQGRSSLFIERHGRPQGCPN